MRLLSKRTIAARLDVSTKTIDRMVDAGEFPPPSVSLGPKTERWFEAALVLWMTQKSAETSGAVKRK